MFDRFMERTLPLWLMVSALLPVVIAYMLFRAAFRIRQLHALLDEASGRLAAGGQGVRGWKGGAEGAGLAPSEAMDWAAVRPGRPPR